MTGCGPADGGRQTCPTMRSPFERYVTFSMITDDESVVRVTDSQASGEAVGPVGSPSCAQLDSSASGIAPTLSHARMSRYYNPQRGLTPMARERSADPAAAVADLARQVESDGGQALAVYREPVGDHWQIFCLLPLDKVEPTPYQRDLSPTHAKRLLEVVKKIDRFVDPIVAVSPQPGLYWTPNGHHRLTALKKLKSEWAPAILIP